MTLSLAMLIVRSVPSESIYSISFWPRVLGFMIGAIYIAFDAQIISLPPIGLFYGIMGGLGVYLTNLSLRYAPIAIVAPYHYTQIVWGTVIGYLIWHHVPTITVVIGAVIVTGSGLFILKHQRTIAKKFATEQTWDDNLCYTPKK